MSAPDRYGNRRVPRMLTDVNALRRAIRAEGTPAIQEAWDRVEPHIDYAYQQNAAPRNTTSPQAIDNGQDADLAPPQWKAGER